jgi:hypothetical protein
MNAIGKLFLVNFEDKLIRRQGVEHFILLAQLCELFGKILFTVSALYKLLPSRHSEQLKILRVTKPFNNLNLFHQSSDQRKFQII